MDSVQAVGVVINGIEGAEITAHKVAGKKVIAAHATDNIPHAGYGYIGMFTTL
jgi:hypothetical protein